MKKALVTGANGFIGGHIIDNLIKRNYQVWAVARGFDDLLNEKINLIQVDATNLNSLRKILKILPEVDEIYNSIGLLGYRKVKDEIYWRVNYQATKNLLEVCSKYKNIKRFFHISSAGVVGPIKTGIIANEEYIGQPSNIYEETKLAGEKIVFEYCNKQNIPFTIIRPEFVYGPRDKHVLRLIRAIAKRYFFIIGSGKKCLHPTYIDDLISVFEKCIDNPKTVGQIYIIAGPKFLAINELVGTIAKVLEVRKPIRLPMRLVKMAIIFLETLANYFKIQLPLTKSAFNFFTQNRSFSTLKAETDFKYQPRFNFKEGLIKTIGWYKRNNYL